MTSAPIAAARPMPGASRILMFPGPVERMATALLRARHRTPVPASDDFRYQNRLDPMGHATGGARSPATAGVPG